MREENWKTIEGYEDLYKISDNGRVKSLEREVKNGIESVRKVNERILKPGVAGRGYEFVNLCKEGKRANSPVHILVWEHFGNKPRNGRKLQVDHVDGKSRNNRIENLQLLTNRENVSKGKLINKKTSKYTGVSWEKHTKKWAVRIKINGKQKYIGGFEDEKSAANAYKQEVNQAIWKQ